MLKNYFSNFLFFAFFGSMPLLKAQITLPYYSGFNNETELDGWTEYHVFSNDFSEWSVSSANGFQNSAYISHDYAPSSGDSIADDWYVSPEFLIPEGGTLDSLRYRFSGFSTPELGDTVGVYLLTGSQDPTLATSKTLLKDFRGTDYTADNIWYLLNDIDLPLSNESNYIAIRYKNTDVSSKWLTVGFDNIAINTNSTFSQYEFNNTNISIFPNPNSGIISIKSKNDIVSLEIFNTSGQKVYNLKAVNGNEIKSLDLSQLGKGLYFLSVNNNNTQKIIIK